MKNLKISFLLAALVFISQSLFAMNVRGTVTDYKTSKPISGVHISVKNSHLSTLTDENGQYNIQVPSAESELVFSYLGYISQTIKVGYQNVLNIQLKLTQTEVKEVITLEAKPTHHKLIKTEIMPLSDEVYMQHTMAIGNVLHQPTFNSDAIPHNTEEYDVIHENTFKTPQKDALSTFSIDVDAASYSNVRRVINSGNLPQKDMVRIEEMINYFNYDYPQPQRNQPFSVTTEVGEAPWNPKHHLVHIGLQGKSIDYDDLQPSNLVFLIDVSGSMSAGNKLPLVKSSLKLLVNHLKPTDKIALVVYAGAAGLVLPSTPVSQKETIIQAIDNLNAGGSTAGGAGIKLAYQVAKQNLIQEGNNRVILATDGDFNIGVSSTAAMVELIEENRDAGVFLTITGFGMGNYKDGRMEQISNAGNGNYFYIDNIKEAEKVFVKELRATLFTIAKDVKIQVEFNPAYVKAYRLIGYENRKLNAEDFNNDKKDAGELGAGHTVTALYEIIPVGVNSNFLPDIDDLKYQSNKEKNVSVSDELLTIKLRYKAPNGQESKLITHSLKYQVTELNKTSHNFMFSAAVAEFGMLLRDSEFKQGASYQQVLELANTAKGKDENGYRQEFIQMVNSSKLMANK